MSVDGMRDDELVAGCVEGRAECWAALIDRYRRLIYSVPRRFGLHADHADEIFQRTCISLFDSLSGLRNIDRITGWISVTAANHARMMIRANRRRTDADPEWFDEGIDEPPADELARVEEAALLRASLNRIDARCRRLLEVLYFDRESLGYDAISKRLGMPRGSIGPTRARCLDKLRRQLQESGWES